MSNPCPTKAILQSVDATGKQAFVLQNFYCIPMSRIGKCTRVCAYCQDTIDNIFETARSVENPRNFEAILTYTAREKIAEIQEEGEAPAKLPTTWLGELDTRNPFDLLADIL